MSPFAILYEAQLSICNAPEWLDVDGARMYPQPIHLAHSLLDRARLHLGIRAVEGYAGKQSVTEQLLERIEGGPQ